MGGVVQGVGSMVDNTLGTSIFGSNANDQALASQTGAANQAMGTIKSAYQDSQAQLQPWQQAGTDALAQLAGGNIGAGYTESPGYQAQLMAGQTAINNGMAARGMGNSGAALKALTSYSQDQANQDYQQYYNNEANRLGMLTGYGMDATKSGVAASTGYGANIAGLQKGIGDAQAGAAMGKANQQQNFIKQGANFAALFSDERLKENLKVVSKEETEEMGKILKAYHFNYTSDEHGKGEWVGVMAQDLEKHPIGKDLVETNSEGLKTINQNKVLSMFLAYFAEAA